MSTSEDAEWGEGYICRTLKGQSTRMNNGRVGQKRKYNKKNIVSWIK